MEFLYKKVCIRENMKYCVMERAYYHHAKFYHEIELFHSFFHKWMIEK